MLRKTGHFTCYEQRYAQLSSEIVRAAKAYAEEVRMGVYPEPVDGHGHATQPAAMVPLN